MFCNFWVICGMCVHSIRREGFFLYGPYIFFKFSTVIFFSHVKKCDFSTWFSNKFKFSDSSRAEQFQELYNATPELEKLKQDYQDLFSLLSESIQHDVCKFIISFNTKILKIADSIPVEELSEIVQNFYQVFAKRMEANSIYTGITNSKHTVYVSFSFISLSNIFRCKRI
jgi:hypothetical protein